MKIIYYTLNRLDIIIIQMHLNFLHICIILALHFAVSAYYVIPLRAGTIQITDSDFRKDKIIKRMIDLSLTKAQYQSHKDTNVIASITSLSMDQNLNFHFGYEIICPQNQCFLNFTLVRYTVAMSEKFSYSITADYLVARGIKVKDLNMTFFQEHIYLQNVESYDQNNVKQDLSKDLPYNNEDAWYMLLFPTGFNNLTLTGHVVYSYILETDMYVVHYMDHTGQHGEHDSMGWKEKQNYIRFRAVFIPEKYVSYEGCSPDEEFTLTQHYEYTCNGGSDVKWFVGLKGTKETQIQGELFDLRAGFSYSLAKTPSRYGLMAFPFVTNDDFIDLRVHEYKWEVEYRMIGTFAGYTIAIALLVGLALTAAFFVRRVLRRSRKLKTAGKYDHMHEEAPEAGEPEIGVSPMGN